jgi:outer membrane receptor protein involved in Fe transport
MRRLRHSSIVPSLVAIAFASMAAAQTEAPPRSDSKPTPEVPEEAPKKEEPEASEKAPSDEVHEGDEESPDSEGAPESDEEESPASEESAEQLQDDAETSETERSEAVDEAEGDAVQQEADVAPAEEIELLAPPGVEGLWELGEEPYRPPPATLGVVWGRILEPDSGAGALEAQVKVQGKSIETYTDLDGYYRLELPPGTYTVEIFYALHELETHANIVVVAGELNRVDTTLHSQEAAVDTVIIEEEADTQTVEGLALARQRSAAQGDAVGREEIAKTTDSNAAEAAGRIVGANIVGGRFVYVRGLGERYSNSLLSGFPLPSPEPDRAAVPLDVFPTPVLDSLTIVKTFTPDMPADFAGGSVQIETRSVPSEPMLKVSLSGGMNTQSTFRKRLDHPSSATDFLGFDSGMRKLPSSVPGDYPATIGAQRPDGSTVEAADLVKPGRDMNSSMSPEMDGTPMNHGFGIVGGNTWDIGRSKLGFLGALNYSRSYESFEDVTLISYDSSTDDERGFYDRVNYKFDQGIEKIRWGAFGKVSLMSSGEHKVSLTGLHSQLADDMTTQYSGINREAVGDYQASQLDWVERGMSFGLLSGRHTLRSANDAEFDWDLSIARAYRSEPDRRDTVYRYSDRISAPDEPGGRSSGWEYVNKTTSGRHFWAHQTEQSNGGKLDWMQPLLKGDTKLAGKAGGLVNIKRRSFNVRRFQMEPTGNGTPLEYSCVGDTYRLDCPDDLFTDDNVGTLLELNEGTQETDAYDADLNVYAVYLMGDVDFSERLRLIAGARTEWTQQKIDPYNQFGGTTSAEGADLRSTDVLPSISTVYSASEKVKIRAAYGHTLARPQVRELAPFAFSDYFGGTVVSGNPDLTLTSIKNVDLRFEFWPSLTEVLAVSLFYKHLKDPIEELQYPTGGAPSVTYRNADRADVLGTELEARRSLEFLNAALSPFQVISNLTVSWSQTEVQEDAGNSIITNPERPLINQAPWVLNFALDYQNDKGTGARVTYNVNGRTLARVGTENLPDTYKQSFHSLDLSASQKIMEHWSMKVSIENIINDNVLETVGKTPEDDNGDGEPDNVSLEYRKGMTLSLGIAYEL